LEAALLEVGTEVEVGAEVEAEAGEEAEGIKMSYDKIYHAFK